MYTQRLPGARIAAAALLATLAGCQTLPDTRGVLFGSVTAPSQVAGPFVVAAIDRNAGTIQHRVFLERQGEFTMRIDAGAYKFIAFADTDRDGQLGPREPVSVRMALKAPLQEGEMMSLPALDIRAP